MKQQHDDAVSALNLIVERTLLNDTVKRLTAIIGEHTKQCHGVAGGRKRIIDATARHDVAMAECEAQWEEGGYETDGPYPPVVEPEVWSRWHDEPTHLTHAFRRIGTKVHMGDRDTKTHLSAEEVIAEIAVCLHCTEAYKAVIARKEARKALAHMKRQMTALARKQFTKQ